MTEKPWRRAGYLERLPADRHPGPPAEATPTFTFIVPPDPADDADFFSDGDPHQALIAIVMTAIILAVAIALLVYAFLHPVSATSR